MRVDGEVTKKAGQIWLETAEIKIAEEAPGFVSRAGTKLAHALEQFEMECEGKTILDLGASKVASQKFYWGMKLPMFMRSM